MIEIIKKAVMVILENEEISQGKSVRFFVSEEALNFEQISEQNSEEESAFVDIILYGYPGGKKWEVQFFGINYNTLLSGNLFNALRKQEPNVYGVVETIIEGVPTTLYTINSY